MVLMKSKEQLMDKPLTSVELSLATPPVTKRQRLQRFADVIRSGPSCPLYLFINLEYRDAGEWKYLSHPGSPFALAAQDNVLYAAGLRSGVVSFRPRSMPFSLISTGLLMMGPPREVRPFQGRTRAMNADSQIGRSDPVASARDICVSRIASARC